MASRDACERGEGGCKNREELMAALLHCEPTASGSSCSHSSRFCFAHLLNHSADKYRSKSFSDTDLLISFCQLTVWLLYRWADVTPSCESTQHEKKSSWPQQMIDIYLSACQGAAISSWQK